MCFVQVESSFDQTCSKHTPELAKFDASGARSAPLGTLLVSIGPSLGTLIKLEVPRLTNFVSMLGCARVIFVCAHRTF